jgi:uncharacterized membrane protein YjjB (DUF3815 family)
MPACEDLARKSMNVEEGNTLVDRVSRMTSADMVCALALTIAVTVGTLAWGIGVVYRGYDYDEVLRAHAVWSVSQGLRPYHDFLECHPPYFILLTPIVSSCSDPNQALLAFRIIAMMGNLAFLAGLTTLGLTSVSSGRPWAVLATAVVAFHPTVLSFLAEFRIDGWGYAIVIWSLLRFARAETEPGAGLARSAEMAFLTGLASLLLCPKLAPLPPLVVFFAAAKAHNGIRGKLRPILGYALGMGVAALAMLTLLKVIHVEVGPTVSAVFVCMKKYNDYYIHSFGRGLLKQVVTSSWLSPLMVLGFCAWIAECVRGKKLPDAIHAGLAAWLVIQLVIVAFPYKQYVAPWFLFASIFLGFLGQVLSRAPRRWHALVFVAACGLSVYGSVSQGISWSRDNAAGYERMVIGFLNKLALPGDYVVATSPHHPVYRRDAFYLAMSFLDHGYDADRVLDDLPALRDRVTPQRYLHELEVHSPAFIHLQNGDEPMPYSNRQNEVIKAYVREHGYRTAQVAGILLAVRPDRFDRFLRLSALSSGFR